MKLKVLFEENYEENHSAMELIERALEQGARLEQLPFEAEVSVSFTDNEGIREINREQRGIDRATDVLSFPMLDLAPGKQPIIGPEDLDPETGRVYLGDIVISLERAAEQAREFGHSIERETAFLAVHSLMHLLGYDHMTEEEKRLMRTHEEAVLSALSLTREEC